MGLPGFEFLYLLLQVLVFAVGSERTIPVVGWLRLAQLFVLLRQLGLKLFELIADRLAPGVVDLLLFALAKAEAGVVVEGVAFSQVLEGVFGGLSAVQDHAGQSFEIVATIAVPAQAAGAPVTAEIPDNDPPQVEVMLLLFAVFIAPFVRHGFLLFQQAIALAVSVSRGFSVLTDLTFLGRKAIGILDICLANSLY